MPVKAANGAREYAGDNYRILYEVVNEWENGEQIQIIITNTGTESIKNWGLQADANGTISNIWNAVVEWNDGKVMKIRNNQCNVEILPGQSQLFGYILIDKTYEYPETMVLTQQKREVSSEYSVECIVVNDWGSGVQGNLVITNQKAEPIEDWELSFDSNIVLNNLWGAEYSISENHITLKSFNYSNRMEPGQSVTIGFTGVKEEQELVEFSNYALTEMVTYPKENSGSEEIPTEQPTTEEETTVPTQAETESVTDPTMEIDYVTDTDNDGLSDYFEKELGCEVDNPDTDGDGLPDGYEVYTLGTNPLLIDSNENGTTDDLGD